MTGKPGVDIVLDGDRNDLGLRSAPDAGVLTREADAVPSIIARHADALHGLRLGRPLSLEVAFPAKPLALAEAQQPWLGGLVRVVAGNALKRPARACRVGDAGLFAAHRMVIGQ